MNTSHDVNIIVIVVTFGMTLIIGFSINMLLKPNRQPEVMDESTRQKLRNPQLVYEVTVWMQVLFMSTDPAMLTFPNVSLDLLDSEMHIISRWSIPIESCIKGLLVALEDKSSEMAVSFRVGRDMPLTNVKSIRLDQDSSKDILIHEIEIKEAEYEKYLEWTFIKGLQWKFVADKIKSQISAFKATVGIPIKMLSKSSQDNLQVFPVITGPSDRVRKNLIPIGNPESYYPWLVWILVVFGVNLSLLLAIIPSILDISYGTTPSNGISSPEVLINGFLTGIICFILILIILCVVSLLSTRVKETFMLAVGMISVLAFFAAVYLSIIQDFNTIPFVSRAFISILVYVLTIVMSLCFSETKRANQEKILQAIIKAKTKTVTEAKKNDV